MIRDSWEVQMFKNMCDRYLNSGYAGKLRTIAIILIFVFMAVLATAVLFAPGSVVRNAAYFSFYDSRSKDVRTQQAIIDWMAENSSMSHDVLTNIYNAAAETGNRDLILAICLVESNFNPHSKSDKGAVGLMGIMPGVWLRELKEKDIIADRRDLYKVSGNIAAGAYVLASYLAETNDLRQALVRYVGGESLYAARVLQAREQIALAQREEQPTKASAIY